MLPHVFSGVSILLILDNIYNAWRFKKKLRKYYLIQLVSLVCCSYGRWKPATTHKLSRYGYIVCEYSYSTCVFFRANTIVLDSAKLLCGQLGNSHLCINVPLFSLLRSSPHAVVLTCSIFYANTSSTTALVILTSKISTPSAE